MHGLGLNPINDTDRQWLTAHCVEIPPVVCAGESPAAYHPPLTQKNQRRTNTCAGNAFATGRELLNYQRTGTIEVYSALAAYLLAKRLFDGSNNDNGTSISSLFRSAAQSGTPRESSCPFRESWDRHTLTPAALLEAKQHPIGQFVRLWGYEQIRRFQLAGLGFMVLGGPWYQSMSVQDLGSRRETPAAYGGELLGMHARTLTGWYSRDEMREYDAHDERLDLEVWNSHGDGPRPISADAIDRIAGDPQCEVIGCMDQTEFAPQRVVDWLTTAVPI